MSITSTTFVLHTLMPAAPKGTVARGIILFAHGSRDPLWRGPVDAVARRVHAVDTSVAVACAFLEMIEPDLAGCVAEMDAMDIRHITVVPMFLGVGKHAREDLPRLVADLRTRFTHIVFELQATVGENAQLIDMLATIALSTDTAGSQDRPSSQMGTVTHPFGRTSP